MLRLTKIRNFDWYGQAMLD